MSTLGNLLWIFFGGFVICMEYLFAGVILCCTIVGIPFGLQCFKLGFASLTPFGKSVVENNSSNDLSFILNILWFLFGGIWITISHLVMGILFCITIIGIPFGKQHFKLMRLSLSPFGKDLI